MPQARRVDYDRIAATYDRRFAGNERSGTARALLACARDMAARRAGPLRVLEVGCGTGHWLAELATLTHPVQAQVYGLDLSAGMLRQARRRRARAREDPVGRWTLVRGRAEQLPFPDASFDLVYCVNAIHHFHHPRVFVSEARRLLRPEGRLAVVGMDPHGRRESWYVYRYFAGVYETDLARFPSWDEIAAWLTAEGLQSVECRVVERIWAPKTGQEVLEDPFLRKDSSSQLALLGQEAYQAGLRRIEAELARAEAAGETLIFPVDNPLAMISGQLPF